MSTVRLGLRIVKQVERPSPEVVRQLAVFPCALISDAMGKLNTMDFGIKPIYAGMGRVAGPALTVLARPGDNLMATKAIGLAEPGDVVVVSTSDHTTHSVWGGVMSAMAVARRVAGLVTDGVVRDVAQTKDSGFRIWARGVTPLAPARGIPPGQINTPIVCGGVCVSPGDIIVADEDGVVVVPRDEAEAVLEACSARAAKEKWWLEEIRKGRFPLLEDADRAIETAGVAID